MSKQQTLICTPQIENRKGQLLTTSLNVAEVFGKRHDNVLKSIQDMECSEKFRLLNFQESSYKNEQNKKQPMYLMTQSGFTLLAMGFTGKKAFAFKEAYIQAFDAMQNALLQRQNSQWIEERNSGKLARKDLIDAVAQFVDYAKAQGSRNADLYFVNATRMVYRCLGLIEGNTKLPPNFRNLLDSNDLHGLKSAEWAAEQAFLDGIEQQMPYKEIFEYAKNQVERHAMAVLPLIQKRKARQLLRGEPRV